MVSTSRHKVKQQVGKTSREGVKKGAYVLEEDDRADITLLGVGAELEITVEAAKSLREKYGKRVRIVSFPCTRLFDEQPREYKRQVLRRFKSPKSNGSATAHIHSANGDSAGASAGKRVPAVVVEPYSDSGWASHADAGCTMSTFGHSLPGKGVYELFDFTPERAAERIDEYLKGLERGEFVLGEWTRI